MEPLIEAALAWSNDNVPDLGETLPQSGHLTIGGVPRGPQGLGVALLLEQLPHALTEVERVLIGS